jgi:hypothetical protein
MSTRLNTAVAAIVFVLGAFACSNPAAAPEVEVTPIQIDRVEVRVLESSPPQATARVEGVIGDGCSELHSESQSRTGNTVTLTILRARPRGAICTQQAKLYAADVSLQGQYPPGDYVLRVNGVEEKFRTE